VPVKTPVKMIDLHEIWYESKETRIFILLNFNSLPSIILTWRHGKAILVLINVWQINFKNLQLKHGSLHYTYLKYAIVCT